VIIRVKWGAKKQACHPSAWNRSARWATMPVSIWLLRTYRLWGQH